MEWQTKFDAERQRKGKTVMLSFGTFFIRLFSIFFSLNMLLATVISEHSEKPTFTPGETLAQSPFSCEAETERDAG